VLDNGAIETAHRAFFDRTASGPVGRPRMRSLGIELYPTAIMVHLTGRPVVADPTLRKICSEFAAMIAFFKARHPEAFEGYYPCVAEVHGPHYAIAFLPVLDRWTNRSLIAPDGEDLEPYVSTAVDNAVQNEYSFFKMEVSSYDNNIALMFFEKGDLNWVAHRYGIMVTEAPLKMMRLCKKRLSDHPGYDATASLCGLDWSWCLTTTVLIAMTLRKDECDGCGESFDQLKKCARCRSVRYCSQACQKAHWKEHKPSCKEDENGVVTGKSDYFEYRAKFLGQPECQGPVTMLML
jgi:hypothetical protein